MTGRQIERQITIEAPLAVVWELVSEPGWWINDGDIVAHQIERDQDLARVSDPVHGTFEITTLDTEPQRYVRFGWGGRVDETPRRSTTVEFWLAETGPGVTVTVRETGFDDLPGTEEDRSAAYRDNDQGWQVELDALSRHGQRLAQRVG